MNHQFTISGMHCPACKMLIEDVLGDVPDITAASVNEATQTLNKETASPLSSSEWLPTLTAHLKPFNYDLTVQ